MELIERLPLRPIQWLSQLNYTDFISFCLNKEKQYTTDDCKQKYSLLQHFCKINLQNRGITKRIYSYSTEFCGRLFSGGSLQGMPCKIRGLLMRNGIGTDIDMANAHPVILRFICKLHNIQCPQLEYYINNREECLSMFESRHIGKDMFIKSLNKASRCRSSDVPTQYKLYDAEIKEIQKQIVKIKTYIDIVESVPHTKTYNKLGSAVNRILCYYENIILQHAIDFITSKQIEITALMFDGLMIYGNYYSDKKLLEDMTDYVECQMCGLNMKWTYKEHSSELRVPDDFVFIENPCKPERIFESIAEEFEKTHLKIVNKSLFVKHANNNIIFLTQAQLKMSYSHLSYDSPVYDKNNVITGISTLPFINKWISHEHNIRRKDDIDIYPNTDECPPNIFNMWQPFAMEQMTGDYAHKTCELEVILNHIKILCNHDSAVYDYFIKWIAQMIQYPHLKTIMPTFISGEGAGKGTLFKLFEKMLGDEKVFETTNPSRDVWGDFNSIMRNCFLVNLNELSKKDTLEAEGKIKGLITDTSLTINQKGIDPYQIKSYHRFIVTTNKGEPLNSSKGDRRNLIIRSSDEKKGDSAYFQVLHSYLDDINVIRTCYDYFKSIPDMDKFKDIPLPHTEYQENLKELSRSPIELWLESWTREQLNNDVQSIELLGSEVFELFKQWCTDNGVKYEVDCLKLGVRLTNMNIAGVYKGTHCKNGKTKKFVISELKHTFKM
jgi:hypothetical protein